MAENLLTLPIRHIQLTANGLTLLDQRRLPSEEVYQSCTSLEEIAKAIETLLVRGAPAIGIAAAMGVAWEVRLKNPGTAAELDEIVVRSCERLARTRPTAVNLFWALERMHSKMKEKISAGKSVTEVTEELWMEALAIQEEDIAGNRAMGAHGARLLPQGVTLLTHCNAGALATGGYGTALGVVRAAWEQGKLRGVVATETRPIMQGARLTAWELHKEGIPLTCIVDSAVGYFLSRRQVQAVIVGADRIAANGDVANKIGTLNLAVLAKAYDVPFYVAAPTSTFDLETESGVAIPIEERDATELTLGFIQPRYPKGVFFRNPAFDVTPASLITAIITEKGVIHKPDARSVRVLFC